MARNLTNLFISESFQYLLQESGSGVQNGLGVDVTFLDVSASHAVTASFLTGQVESASYSDVAAVANSVDFDNITNTPTLLSGSSQIATDISGAFDEASSSLASRITAQEDFSSSLDATFATDAELNAVSSSVATDITNIVDGVTVVASASNASTSNLADVASLANNVSYNNVSGKPTLVSSSAQIDLGLASGIATSASYAETASVLLGVVESASFATTAGNVDFTDVSNKPTLLSGSTQIATDISGAFTSTSQSIATDISNIVDGTTTVQYASNTVVVGKNLSGGLLSKGTPLYITGSGTAGNIAGIYPADAGNPNRYPAGAILGEDLNDGEEGTILLDGFINGVDTSGFDSGDKIYLAVGGGYTNVAPTGSSNIIQFLGNVEKSDINGSGLIQMMGESRQLPNLQQGSLIVGGAGDVPTTITSSSFAKVAEDNTFTGTQTFDNIAVNGTGSFAVIQSVTGSAKIIGDAFIILNNNLPAERYAGIAVIDSGSGSPNVTASYQYDGQSNDWFYEYTDDGGVTTEHGIAIFGPEYNTIGNPTYLTSGSIPKADGGHHLYDSIISDNGSTVTVSGDIVGDIITANTNFSGNLTGNVTGNASTATTASFATTALSSSFADNATSSSFSDTSISASFASNSTSASFADNSTSSSYADNALSASYSVSSSLSEQSENYNTSSGSLSFWSGNQGEYNAISASADVNTIYFVVE